VVEILTFECLTAKQMHKQLGHRNSAEHDTFINSTPDHVVLQLVLVRLNLTLKIIA
jgi:hypothetical protein